MASRKTKRYLLYVTGELSLVVIGILVALQINNWNEERLEQSQIREFALDLAVAIERDMEMLQPVDMQIRASIRQAEVLADYLRDRTPEEMDNAELFFLTTLTGYRPYGWNRAALEQLKAAGGLRQMRNRHLAGRISDYDALTQHVDQDYREDEEWARAIQELANELIDRNYVAEGLEAILTWDDGFEFAENTAARTDIELPRLRQFAAEIQAQIDDEYR